eukprot:TRINITY_DN616_c0_g1_i5.p1 TRINITY_DN616_c0_g1~~TRINITY_DN616_c0_g1_i5.p1  ORF type:complete len:453 (-),score=125.83 TRINITY_DN616_c0_g1_i5:81-1439(-)
MTPVSLRVSAAAAAAYALATCVKGAESFVTTSSGAGGLRQRAFPAGSTAAAELTNGLASRLPRPSEDRLVQVEAETTQMGAAAVLVSVVTLAGASVAARNRSSRRGLVARRARMVATRPDQAIPWWQRLVRPRIEEGVGIWAEKLNMTTIFDEQDGNWRTIPATILVIKRGGNVVTGKRWPEKHGYYAVQMGYDQRPPEEMKYVAKRGGNTAELAMAKIAPLKKLREFTCRPQDWEKYEVGQKVWPSEIFKEGDIVDLHSRSKGKGFQGNVTRWGLHRGPMSHGSKHHRRVGSVAGDGRVWPGKKMPGWVGDTMHCQKGGKILKIIDRIDEDNMPESIIVISGSVAGYTAHTEKGGSYVYLHPSKSKYGMTDGRFKRDPVWLWYTAKGEDVDELVPLRKQAWTWKTHWGQDMRWKTAEVKKYWPDGFPGYDHGPDPFHDECDPHLAIKAPEW